MPGGLALLTAVASVVALIVPATGSWAAEAGEHLLEEIIVTASKRSTKLQQTPIAITVFTGEELSLRRVDITNELQFKVPNLLVSRGIAFDNIVIRGVGYSAVDGTASPGTAVHFNGVYLQNRQILDSELFDIERVEVLRGPQGTLYGRNATAGVVNIISRKPEDVFGGDISIQLGNYQTRRLTADLNIPITDQLWQRFSAFYLQRDGYTENLHSGNKIDGRDMYALRSTTALQLGSATDITLTLDYLKEDSDRSLIAKTLCSKDPDGILGCLPDGLRSEVSHSGATLSGFLNTLLPPFSWPEDDYANSLNPRDLREVISDFEPVYESQETLGILEVNHDFGAWHFTSLSAYRETERDIGADYDLAVASESWPVDVVTDLGPYGTVTVDSSFTASRDYMETEQWSQEFRFASAYQGNYNTLLGLNWLKHEQSSHETLYSSSLSYAAQVFSLGPEGSAFISEFKPYQSETWALFGEFYYDFSERSQLTLGLRYTDEEKELVEYSRYLFFLDETNHYQDRWDDISGKISLDYHSSDDVMLYATLSRSHKSGGFNASEPHYKPEHINALEVGVKSRLLDRRVQANITAFYYDYTDLQFSRIQDSFVLTENADAISTGVEAELQWHPDKHWRIDANLAVLHTELGSAQSIDLTDPNQMGNTQGITSFAGENTLADGSLGIPVDLEGRALPYAPDLSTRLGVSYRHAVGGYSLTYALDYYWQDEFYARVYNARNDQIDSWNVWDFVALVETDQGWYIQGYIKNIRDDDFVTGHTVTDPAAGLFRSVSVLEPRTYGLRMGMTF